MATAHIIGKDLTVKITDKDGITVKANLLDDLHETAKMKLAVSTSGFIPTGATIDGKPVMMNLQLGIKK